ncbi:Hypothetical protein R9X50_00160100 [Acrodontium crateriforme]|uniref:gamma-glutamylcyclotransferase n=1 Tax=Acrodontium crateriforme TaxID=150365 RepID=A0AAQ3R2X6_9PEZI|nr:Hypothetical protein R9X50_00160100 [Acrodontium crateriforme]
MSPTKPPQTLYFGYGSNLWLHQMHQRCPTSTYHGIARLKQFRWIINARGYANIVALQAETLTKTPSYENEVWGLIYSLSPKDEERLDRNEGVPVAYTKEMLEVEFWAVRDQDPPDVKGRSEMRSVLVYINRILVEADKPKTEYVFRMNMGIRDALAQGVPRGYVEQVMRNFIPEDESGGDGESGKELAMKQAEDFEDGL